MCDLYSWGLIKTRKAADQLGKPLGSVIFLTDSEAEHLLAAPLSEYRRRFDEDDVLGHEALAAYFRITTNDFHHCEGTKTIPKKLAIEVNAGHLDGQFRRSKQASIFAPYRYTSKGKQKALVYLPDFKSKLDRATKIVHDAIVALHPRMGDVSIEKAVKAYTDASLKDGKVRNVNEAFVWSYTSQGSVFWLAIYTKTQDALDKIAAES
jgi:hypothetical protein